MSVALEFVDAFDDILAVVVQPLDLGDFDDPSRPAITLSNCLVSISTSSLSRGSLVSRCHADYHPFELMPGDRKLDPRR